MGGLLFNITLKSIWRRKRQLAGTGVLVLVVIMLTTMTVLFRDNMYYMQTELNKEKFEDWFVMQYKFSDYPGVLEEHIYLEEGGQALIGGSYWDAHYLEVQGMFGFYTPRFIQVGNIKLKEGHYPVADNEIALEYDVLMRMNPEGKLGSTVTIYYYDGVITESNRRSREYIVSGILESYTGVWNSGIKIPDIVMTESECRSYGNRDLIKIYPLKDGLTDYKQIFAGMSRQSKGQLIYNSHVYDYAMWGPEDVYAYIYIAIVLVGAFIVGCRLLYYNRTRDEFNRIMRSMGADSRQLTSMRIVENVVIIIFFGIAGCGLGILAGRLVAVMMELRLGVSFYHVSNRVFVSCFAGMMVILATSELMGRIFSRRGDSDRSSRCKNIQWYSGVELGQTENIGRRIMRSDGSLLSMGIRIFYAAALIIIVVCIYNTYSVYHSVNEIENVCDAQGLCDRVDDISQVKLELTYGYMIETTQQGGQLAFGDKLDTLTYEEWKSPYNRDYNHRIVYDCFWESNGALKLGYNKIYRGYDKSMEDYLAGLGGVKYVETSIYENTRVWDWKGASLDKMAFEALAAKTPESDGARYLFSTDYYDANRLLYEKLSKYIEPEYYDYEAFEQGRQVVIFVSPNANGIYDDSIKPGQTMNYRYVNPGLKEPAFDITPEGFDKLGDFRYRQHMEVNQAPLVAGVVYVDADVESDMEGFITEFGYYNAVASTELARKLLDNDGRLYGAVVPVPLTYNRFVIEYTDEHALFATENIVKAYCDSQNIIYEDKTDGKNSLRTKLINAILQNMVTIVLCIVLVIAVSILFATIRFDDKKDSIRRLKNMGMDNEQLVQVCMYGAVSESVCCIMLTPVILFLQWLIYSRRIQVL